MKQEVRGWDRGRIRMGVADRSWLSGREIVYTLFHALKSFTEKKPLT
jgi:hypothetical protein